MLRMSSNGVASSAALAMLALIRLGLLHMAQYVCVVVSFAVSECFSTSKRFAATLLETVGCCGANLRSRTIAAHDDRGPPPTSPTGMAGKGKVEVGFGICGASCMLSARVLVAFVLSILGCWWLAAAVKPGCVGMWFRSASANVPAVADRVDMAGVPYPASVTMKCR